MQLIDRYILEVGSHLPAKQRADLEAEIRSLLEDTLEDRSKTTGRAADEELEVEVLKEFGPPEKMAALYLPERSLIGPRLFPVFLNVMRIVLPILVVLALAGFMASLLFAGDARPPLGEALLQLVNNLGSSLIQGFGTIVLIFALIQWLAPGVKIGNKDKPWDPRSLKARPNPEKVSIGDAVASIVFAGIAIVLFNFYRDRIAIWNLTGSGWSEGITFLTDTFFGFLPWLTILWAADIAFNIILLQQGRWNAAFRWVEIALSAANIVLLTAMITGAPIVQVSTDALVNIPGLNVPMNLLNQGVLSGVDSLLLLIMIIEAINILKMGWRIYKK